MEERRDKEYIIEVTADKEKLEDKGYYYCTTDIEQEILEEKLQNKLRRFHASRKHLPRTAPKAKPWSWNRIRSRPNTKHGYH